MTLNENEKIIPKIDVSHSGKLLNLSKMYLKNNYSCAVWGEILVFAKISFLYAKKKRKLNKYKVFFSPKQTTYS